MKEKRKITPHRGGRSSDLHCRINPDYHERLRRICDAKGISMADWVEGHIDGDLAEIGSIHDTRRIPTQNTQKIHKGEDYESKNTC